MKESYRQKPLLTLAAGVAAMALLLAGCGGGSSSTTPTSPVEPTPPPQPSVDVAALWKTAHDSEENAKAASKAGSDAVVSATENSTKLTSASVAGDSGMAMMNAAAILKAQADAIQAVIDAEAAHTAASAALATAKEDAPDNASLIAALEGAVKVAMEEIEKAKMSRDGDDLQTAVDMVTGGEDADPQGTPRSIATTVGKSIATALLPTDDGNGARASGQHSISPPATDIEDAHKVELHNRVGMTWAQIVGETNIMNERLGTGNTSVMIASVAGMTASTVDIASTTRLTSSGGTNADGKYDDVSVSGGTGTYTADIAYMGIPGSLYCLGGTDGCEVDEDEKLVGSWYFSPQNPMEYYINNPDEDAAEATPYVAETLYATYGHWLVYADDGTVTFNTYATSTAGTNFDVTTVNTGDDATTLTDESATYSGSAAGMSVTKSGENVNSGRFTANVTLTAKFGTPMLSGTINGFSGPAVNENWSVSLQETAFTAGALTNGATVATGRDGVWSATAYGSATTARPAGIFGGFNAHFTDGHAAGAYATRKDD